MELSVSWQGVRCQELCGIVLSAVDCHQLCVTVVSAMQLSHQLFVIVSPRRLAFAWRGCCSLYFWHKPTKLAHSFLFCSCVYFCLYGPFNCISCHNFSWQLSTVLLCFLLKAPTNSCSLISVLLVLSTIHLFMKVSFSPDVILCGWLGLKQQLTNFVLVISCTWLSGVSKLSYTIPDHWLVPLKQVESRCGWCQLWPLSNSHHVSCFMYR